MAQIYRDLEDNWYQNETLLTFAQLARQIPSAHHKTGRSINPSTIWRWFSKGCKSRRGIRVRLEGCRIGGVNYTSEERYRDFVRRINDEGSKEDTSLAIPAAHLAMNHQAREAMQILKARGMLN